MVVIRSYFGDLQELQTTQLTIIKINIWGGTLRSFKV